MALVVAPGDQRFLDFAKVGFPLLFLTGAATLLAAPIFFPFQPPEAVAAAAPVALWSGSS